MENIVREFDIEEIEALEAPVSGEAVAGFIAGGGEGNVSMFIMNHTNNLILPIFL